MVLLHVIRCAAAHCVTIVLSCCVLRCSPACCVIVAWSCIVPQHGPACRVVITRSCIDAMVRCSPTCHHHTVTPGCAAPCCVAVSPSHCHTRVCSAPHRVTPSHCGALLPVMLLSHHCARVCCSPSCRRHAIAPGCTAPRHIVYLAVARCCPLCCHCHRIVARDAMTTLLLVLPIVPLLRCCWWCHGSPSVVAAPARLGVGAGASPWHEGVGMVVGASKQNVMSEKIK